VQTFASLIRDSIEAGASFGDMARRYSSDGSAESGGDLGWFGRKVMVPEFERAAFGLAVGEISGTVKTQFGYHLIKCLARERERVHAAHILFRTSPTSVDQEEALVLAREIREQLVDGADFATLAKEHSVDSATAASGGDLGWIPLSSLPANFAAAIGTSGAGSLLEPVSAEEGIHIIKVAERRDDRPYDLELDRAEITEMARREKTGRFVEEWVMELRNEIYVDVRL